MKTELLGFKAPKKTCTDTKCPYHGKISVKRELFRGRIIKKDAHHSATIEWNRPYYLPKYERYEMRRSRLRVHNPPCLDAQIGQEVVVARTRPLSKTKNHAVVKIIKKENAVVKETKEVVEKKEESKEEM